MKDVTNVSKNGKTYAIFVQRGVEVDGARFFTEQEDLFQVGIFERQTGYQVKAHRHTEQDVQVHTFAEFLYIEQGKIKATVYDEDWSVIAEQEVCEGGFLLFLSGGHSLEVLEPARILEVKQGPYPGDKDAKVFREDS